MLTLFGQTNYIYYVIEVGCHEHALERGRVRKLQLHTLCIREDIHKKSILHTDFEFIGNTEAYSGGGRLGAPPGFSEPEEKEHCHSPQQ